MYRPSKCANGNFANKIIEKNYLSKSIQVICDRLGASEEDRSGRQFHDDKPKNQRFIAVSLQNPFEISAGIVDVKSVFEVGGTYAVMEFFTDIGLVWACVGYFLIPMTSIKIEPLTSEKGKRSIIIYAFAINGMDCVIAMIYKYAEEKYGPSLVIDSFLNSTRF